MGYGTRLSFGCNVGAYFSAIPSFSLHGWIFRILCSSVRGLEAKYCLSIYYNNKKFKQS